MAVGRVNEVAALTGSSYEKMYIWSFCRAKYTGRNNEATVLTRWL